MIDLSQLKNSSRPRKNVQRVGRGVGSGRGKTSCRGHKGYGSRRGFSSRLGYEGGQMRLFRKIPIRGFTRGRFALDKASINLGQIDRFFADGEIINQETLFSKGLIPPHIPGGLKILAHGELNKKVVIEAEFFSKEAIRKLEEKKIVYKQLA